VRAKKKKRAAGVHEKEGAGRVAKETMLVLFQILYEDGRRLPEGRLRRSRQDGKMEWRTRTVRVRRGAKLSSGRSVKCAGESDLTSGVKHRTRLTGKTDDPRGNERLWRAGCGEK